MMAMSRKPISIKPVDIKGPLVCLQGTHLESLSNQHSFPLAKLDEMSTKFNNLLQDDHKSTRMTTLISEYGALLAMRQLSVSYEIEPSVMTHNEAGPTVYEHYTYQKAGWVAGEGWTPRYVDLSSLWVYKVMRNEKIPYSVRYQMWPNTFNSKAGLQSRW